MKIMNESERLLAIFGVVLIVSALGLSITTEVVTRRNLAEHRRLVAAGAPVGKNVKSSYEHHIYLEEQTLAGRWSVPDGHAALGAGFTLFGLLLVSVPRSTSRKRASGAMAAIGGEPQYREEPLRQRAG